MKLDICNKKFIYVTIQLNNSKGNTQIFTTLFGMAKWVELKQMMSSTQFSGCKSECAVIRI